MKNYFHKSYRNNGWTDVPTFLHLVEIFIFTIFFYKW